MFTVEPLLVSIYEDTKIPVADEPPNPAVCMSWYHGPLANLPNQRGGSGIAYAENVVGIE